MNIKVDMHLLHSLSKNAVSDYDNMLQLLPLVLETLTIMLNVLAHYFTI